jgi:diguanylate cyclase (GGDEF)-like protein
MSGRLLKATKISSGISLGLCLLLIALFAGSMPVQAMTHSDKRPDILVLMSYHHGYTWEDRILEGIRQWINVGTTLPTFHIEWMDTKRYPDNFRRENFSRYLNAKYSKHDFDLILTVDDNALDLALSGGKLFDDKPIVFSGVNGDPVEMVADRPGVTGIAERFDLIQTLKVAFQLHPKSNQLLFITSNTESGAGIRRHIEEALQGANIKLPVNHWVIPHLDQLDARLPLLTDKTLLFALGAIPEKKGGRLLGVEELVAYVRARSSLPVYTDLDKAVGFGAVGGYMNSGFKTGQVVAELAARVLSGEPAESIPYVYDPPLSLIFDHRELRRLNIPISALPEGAHLVNTPPSIFDPEFRGPLFGIAFVLTLMLLALTALAIRNRVQASQKAALHYQATHDKLTELPNRAWLIEHLISLQESDSGKKIALVMMDLNRFKLVNDTYGHSFGDEVVAAVAHRLMQWTKAKEELIRFSGDAFVIVMRFVNENELTELCERCEKVLTEPFHVRDMSIPVSAAFGLSTASPGAFEADHLLREADISMYEAKKSGQGKVYRFDSTIHQHAIRQFQIESSLPEAINKGEIQIHFQPIVDSTSGLIAGFETLARWNHPALGTVPPQEFIRVATETGSISKLSQYMLRLACQGFKPQLDAISQPYLSVNVSVIDIYTDAFPTPFMEILSEEGIPPERLVLEVTEDILLGEVNIVKQALTRLREQRVRIAIDDFGTGYASMSYLSNYLVNIIKIDQSFVQNILTNESDQKIVRAIVSMAADLDLTVITEGTETIEQVEILNSLGCKLMQGFVYGNPMPPSEYQLDKLVEPLSNSE